MAHQRFGGFSGFYGSFSGPGCLDGSGDDNGHDSWPLGPCEVNVISGSIAFGLLLICIIGLCIFCCYKFRRLRAERRDLEGPCTHVTPVLKWEGVPSIEEFAAQQHPQARSMLHSLTGEIDVPGSLPPAVVLPLQPSPSAPVLCTCKGTRRNKKTVGISSDFIATLPCIKKHPSRTGKIRRNITAHGEDDLGNWDGSGFVTTHLIGESTLHVDGTPEQLGCTIAWQQSYSHTSNQALRCFGVFDGVSFVGNWYGAPAA